MGVTFVFIVDAANLFWVSRLGDPRMLTALGFAFATALFVSNAAFNALVRSTLSNWVRDGVLTLPLAILMAGWYWASGVVYAQAIASIVVGTGAVLWGWQYVNLLSRQNAATA